MIEIEPGGDDRGNVKTVADPGLHDDSLPGCQLV